MASVKYLFYILLLYGTISLTLTTKRRPLVFVLCLKGFRWDLPYSYSHLPHFRRLATIGSRALWVESEFGGSQTNILSLMSGLHVEHHGRRNFFETIPVINEHVGGHTRLFHWPWFDRQRNQSIHEYLRSGRKGQPEIIETYLNHGRMSLQRFIKYLTSMINSLINDNDRTNLVMSFIDEPFTTLIRHGIQSDSIRRTMLNIDRLIGRLLSLTIKKNINVIILGDHGIEHIDCRRAINLYSIINQRQLNLYTDQYSGSSFSVVVYPKSDFTRQVLLNQFKKIPNEQIQIYSNDQNRLSPKLRLPSIINKPSPIIIFAKEKFYFSYNTEQNPTNCHKNNKNCQQSTIADHSDDPHHLSMRTAFFAYGPLFKKGHINEPVLMTDVYALLRQILCLSPFPLSRGNSFHIHNMLDLTSLSNTCAHLYLSSLNMIKSVSIQSNNQNNTINNDLTLVRINITEKYQIPYNQLIKMRITIN
ncbi:unnamed protein product [Rotaria sordida]|uniref:Uncharacterized protein n=1 Tax=Rotaria sordida TaxID=392033 RepID=A0A813SQ95_9BILA|nr:unnamed protein product [Rotaria sordida]CAF0944233.1 unnamed protein product [Rotaria sordida]CAF1009148.1 unnamed protein product [Rotaria sordida]CAF1070546.1 unnamed protein product [Rotaria sordida]CAF1071056.1 unnamed protein product [Rotaria sordida]